MTHRTMSERSYHGATSRSDNGKTVIHYFNIQTRICVNKLSKRWLYDYLTMASECG